MGITSEEIARLAKVSRSTVSRVINHYPNVPEATRERVLKVIREYDYHPNEMARALAGKASREIGLFLLEQRYGGLMESSFTHRMISELVRVCYENQSALSVYLVQNEQDFETIRDTYRRKKICGGIFAGFEYKMEWVNALSAEGMNMAVIDVDTQNVQNRENVGLLNFDNVLAGYLATKWLIHSGKRRILHIAGDQRLSSLQRQQGYAKAMCEAGLGSDIVIRAGDFKPEKAVEETLRAIREAEFDGIFAASDRMGFGILHALRGQGIRMPEDLALVGCDYVPGIARIQGVELTSVYLPQKALIERAVKMLLGKEPKQPYLTEVEMMPGKTA